MGTVTCLLLFSVLSYASCILCIYISGEIYNNYITYEYGIKQYQITYSYRRWTILLKTFQCSALNFKINERNANVDLVSEIAFRDICCLHQKWCGFLNHPGTFADQSHTPAVEITWFYLHTTSRRRYAVKTMTSRHYDEMEKVEFVNLHPNGVNISLKILKMSSIYLQIALLMKP
jgi:hypothetical protein